VLLLGFLAGPAAWCEALPGLTDLIGECLGEEACARRLASSTVAFASTNSSSNLTGSTSFGGYDIHVEVESDVAGVELVKILADQLAVEPGRVGLVSRTGRSFAFVIVVPADKDAQLLVEMLSMSASDRFVTTSVVARLRTITATTTMIFLDIPRPTWAMTELESPEQRLDITEDVVLSAFFNIRGLTMVDLTISPSHFHFWVYPIFAKVALIAWANGLLWAPPPVKANFSLRLLVVDQCRDSSHSLSDRCREPYNIKIVSKLYQVRLHFGGKFESF